MVLGGLRESKEELDKDQTGRALSAAIQSRAISMALVAPKGHSQASAVRMAPGLDRRGSFQLSLLGSPTSFMAC